MVCMHYYLIIGTPHDRPSSSKTLRQNLEILFSQLKPLDRLDQRTVTLPA
jgi:hypothetical protein